MMGFAHCDGAEGETALAGAALTGAADWARFSTYAGGRPGREREARNERSSERGRGAAGSPDPEQFQPQPAAGSVDIERFPLQSNPPPVQAALRSIDPCVRMPPLADAVGDSQKRKMATVIAVANQKGGVGKTTTTANLGAALALRARRVLLVDLDPQGNLTSAFGLEKDVQQTIAESLLDRRVPLPVVPVANGAARETTPGRNLAVVPAAVGLASAEAQLMNKLGRELRLRDQLLAVEDSYDYVMIDTPPSLGVLTINALVAATKVIIPTEARFFSLQGLQMLEESIDEILYLNPRLEVLGILLSKMDRRLKEERQVADYLRQRWGERVFATEVGTNSKILEAGSAGTSVFHYLGADRAVEAYLSLADEVIRRA
jgi:chromosome partitioning protein